MPETDSPVADADVNSDPLLAELARVRAMYVALLERSVNDRRRLMQRLAEAGLEDPDPKEGIRMELLAAWPWAVDGTELAAFEDLLDASSLGATHVLAAIGRTPGAPRPDDADWNSPEDASYDQHQEQK